MVFVLKFWLGWGLFGWQQMLMKVKVMTTVQLLLMISSRLVVIFAEVELLQALQSLPPASTVAHHIETDEMDRKIQTYHIHTAMATVSVQNR